MSATLADGPDHPSVPNADEAGGLLARCVPWEAREAAAAIRRRWQVRPQVGLILGTGQGALAEELAADLTMSYAEIPHFPRSTALSHRGQLVCGRWLGVPVVTLDGRCHLYEGYSLEQLMRPVYTLRALGVGLLILSNAAGGLNPRFASGDVMVIEDHVSLLFGRRLVAPERQAALGPQRGRTERGGRDRYSTSLSEDCSHSVSDIRPALYDGQLIDQALTVARRENIAAQRGVYVAMLGPNYETRAEYRYLRRLGGDAVGMSTVPEVIAAARCGLRTLGLSIITNVARPDHPAAVHAEEVVATAAAAEPKVGKIAAGIVSGAGHGLTPDSVPISQTPPAG